MNGWSDVMKYYSCLEHVEEAMDHIIDESELAPILEEVEQSDLSTTCSFCSEKALYLISG